MIVGLITQRYTPARQSPLVAEVVQLLTAWGVMVQLIYPEEQVAALSTLRAENDLYVLTSGTDLALSFAGALTARGAIVINSYRVASLMRDRSVATSMLANAGVPVPETYLAAHPRQFAQVQQQPLVIKSHSGAQRRGARVLWDPEELERDLPGQGPSFAQLYLAPEGEDRKIYCIGGQLFGVLRKWPAKTCEERIGVPFTLSKELREMAVACGHAFDVDLFGIDVVFSDGTPYVVDIHSFPSFAGVPDAARRLADYIFTVAQRVAAGGEALLKMEAAI